MCIYYLYGDSCSDSTISLWFIKELIMYKNKEPIILSDDKVRRIYVTLDTIRTPLVSVVIKKNNENTQVYAEAYRVAGANIDVCGLKHDYATEQFIYRITGVCCNAYDNTLARACVCLTDRVCCRAWTERKQNFIILPDSDILPANLYWITVFELVYKLKYPQSDNTNKCLVYALNCMLKAGMLEIDDCLRANKIDSAHHDLLHTYSLHQICTYLKSNILRIPKSVYRYYEIFGKRLKRKYKNDQMPNGRVFHLPKYSGENAVVEAYTDAICECIKLNTPVFADDITKRKKSKGQFADVRQMKHNIDFAYVYAHLCAHGEPVRDYYVYSNPWAFVSNSLLGLEGFVESLTRHIYLRSEYSTDITVEENSIQLMFVMFHECAHVYHWRAKSRRNSMSSDEAHSTKKCGATYEHHANKFAVWNLIVCGISIETISSALSNGFDKLCARIGHKLNHSHRVLLRYCRLLSYFNSKYGKLHMPTDLGYIFVDHETEKLYKPNDEIKCMN